MSENSYNLLWLLGVRLGSFAATPAATSMTCPTFGSASPSSGRISEHRNLIFHRPGVQWDPFATSLSPSCERHSRRPSCPRAPLVGANDCRIIRGSAGRTASNPVRFRCRESRDPKQIEQEEQARKNRTSVEIRTQVEAEVRAWKGR